MLGQRKKTIIKIKYYINYKLPGARKLLFIFKKFLKNK